jgi:outer membrane protein TolC
MENRGNGGDEAGCRVIRSDINNCASVGGTLESRYRQDASRSGEGGKGFRSTAKRLAIFCAMLALLMVARSDGFGQHNPKRPPETDAALQAMEPGPQSTSGPPMTITLQDALQRAQQNSPDFQAAVTATRLAREDLLQAKAARYPSVAYTTQYINNQGNGISPVGRFVTNDGVHIYRAWGVFHEDMPGTFFISAGTRGAAYARALAQAEQEIARRGLVVTVTTAYYGLVAAQRGYATAQISLENARRFLQISEALEHGGEVAHTDVIRSQLQYNQQQQALQNAFLAMSKARLDLAVLLFPSLNQNFTVVDDLDFPPPLPSFNEVQAMAQGNNPELRAAMTSLRQARLDVSVARAAFYPSLSIDLDYGIEANAFALKSINTDTGVDHVRQPNLGYLVTYAVNLPIWDWGARFSKLRQAEYKRQLARVNLSFAQRQLLSHLYSFYNDARVAQQQLETLRTSEHLAERNLQLVTMSYKAGESTVIEVVDAENSLSSARDSYGTGAAAYRTALATLQTLTGSF